MPGPGAPLRPAPLRRPCPALRERIKARRGLGSIGLGIFAVLWAVLWGTAAPAGDPEVPERYISVDETKALLDLKRRVVIIDVRSAEQFDEQHIRGARNIPLRELPRRLAQVPRQDFVVLY